MLANTEQAEYNSTLQESIEYDSSPYHLFASAHSVDPSARRPTSDATRLLVDSHLISSSSPPTHSLLPRSERSCLFEQEDDFFQLKKGKTVDRGLRVEWDEAIAQHSGDELDSHDEAVDLNNVLQDFRPIDQDDSFYHDDPDETLSILHASDEDFSDKIKEDAVPDSVALIATSLKDELKLAPDAPSPGQFFGRRSGRLGTLEGIGAPPERPYFQTPAKDRFIPSSTTLDDTRPPLYPGRDSKLVNEPSDSLTLLPPTQSSIFPPISTLNSYLKQSNPPLEPPVRPGLSPLWVKDEQQEKEWDSVLDVGAFPVGSLHVQHVQLCNPTPNSMILTHWTLTLGPFRVPKFKPAIIDPHSYILLPIAFQPKHPGSASAVLSITWSQQEIRLYLQGKTL